MDGEDPSVEDPDGRLVVFDAGTRLHLSLGRPELAYAADLILGTVLRVVVDYGEEPAWVVTAFVQNNPPRGWER